MDKARKLDPADSPDTTIGANVHTLMWRARHTQTAVALELGLSQAALSLKLRGKRPWFAAEIDYMANKYGVTRDELFTTLIDPAPSGGTLRNNN